MPSPVLTLFDYSAYSSPSRHSSHSRPELQRKVWRIAETLKYNDYVNVECFSFQTPCILIITVLVKCISVEKIASERPGRFSLAATDWCLKNSSRIRLYVTPKWHCVNTNRLKQSEWSTRFFLTFLGRKSIYKPETGLALKYQNDRGNCNGHSN